MGWFAFDWFTSKERKEYNTLKAEKGFIDQEVKQLREKLLDNAPYSNIYFSDGNVTIVFKDGSITTKSDVDQNLVNRIKLASTHADIISLLANKVTENNINLSTPQEDNMVKGNTSVLEHNNDFQIHGNQVFLSGIQLELPTIVLASFIEILENIEIFKRMGMLEDHELDKLQNYEDQYEALKMFWYKLALNGIEQSRTDLLNFCRLNDVRITRNGNLVLYRRIVSLGDKNKALVAFISQQYYKIKSSWKKSPKNYYVYKTGNDYELRDQTVRDKNDIYYVGNLDELYKNLPRMEINEYTSSHNSGKHIIRIGEIYRIDESEINLNNGLCAAGGLHAAAVDYNYSSFGDTPVVVLINPSKAITVPTGETGKLRTTEMFVAAINDKPHGEHFDNDALFGFDEEYNDLTIEELEKALKEKSFAPAVVEEQVSPITFMDLDNIKNLLKIRVKQI